MATRQATERQGIATLDLTILLILLAFFAGAVVGSRLSHAASGEANWMLWWDSILQNFGTEMLGAFLTFGLIEVLRGYRERQQTEEQTRQERLAELIRSMGSQDNATALTAVRELWELGWITDGSLQGAVLDDADLRGARLQRANLYGAHLWGANLQGADLSSANLHRALLGRANLQGARLWDVNLQGAVLWEVNLNGALLSGAHLRGANLRWANLQGAYLLGANLQAAEEVTCDQLRHAATLKGARLPDGTVLPGDDTWHEAFETWCKQIGTDEKGYIVVRDDWADNDND